jgi:hypothetical protein
MLLELASIFREGRWAAPRGSGLTWFGVPERLAACDVLTASPGSARLVTVPRVHEDANGGGVGASDLLDEPATAARVWSGRSGGRDSGAGSGQ